MTAKANMTWMRLDRRGFLASAAAGAFALGLPKAARAAAGRNLRLRSYSDLQSLDPAFASGLPDEAMQAMMYSKLVQFKPGSWDIEMDAAAMIEQVDPTHIKFALRDDMGFSRGFGAMTAEDVKFSFERVVDPTLAAPNAVDFGTLSHVEVTGEREGTIVFKEPFAPAWRIALPHSVGNIVSKKAWEAAGGRVNVTPAAESGPYMFESFQPNQRTSLVKNPDYRGPAAQHFERIDYLPIGDENAAEIAFEAGELDVTGVPVSSIERLRAAPPKGASLNEFPSLYYVWLGMNMEHPVLADLRVRQAIQYAVDIEMILQAAYFGVAEPATGLIAPGLTGHRPQSAIPVKGDIEKAKALLDEAGVSGLTITLDINNTTTFSTIAQIIQANLAMIGITLDIRMHDSASFWSIGDESAGEQWKDIQLVLNRFSMNPDPSYATAWFTRDQIGIWNWERFASEEFDQLHAAGASEVDETKRDAIYRRAVDLMEESGAYRFLTHEALAMLVRDDIKAAFRPDGFSLVRHFAPA